MTTEFHQFAQGETVAGRLVDLDVWESPEYGDSPILIIEQADGSVVQIRASQQVLLDELVKRSPVRGEHVAITYDGEVQGRGGKTYHRFRVIGGEIEFTWTRFGGRDRRATTTATPDRPVPVRDTEPPADTPGVSEGTVSTPQRDRIDELLSALQDDAAQHIRDFLAREDSQWRRRMTARRAQQMIAYLEQLEADTR